MQLKRIGLVVTSAALALVWAGCPEGDDGNTGACTATSCGAGQICHPVEKVCVKTCTSSTDCPDSAKTCAPLATAGADGGTSQNICQCATTALCNAGQAGGSLVCSDETKVCVVKCSTDAACGTGRKCDTATGQCKTQASTCTPACAATETCDTTQNPPKCVAKCGQGTCTGGKVCNFTSGACETPKTCAAANPQPDACSYGQFCSGTSCGEVPKPTCTGFTSSSHAAAWGVGKSGAVIHAITKDVNGSQNASTFCGGKNRYKVKIEAYDLAGTFPAGSCTNAGAQAGTPEQSMRAKLHLVDASGDEVAVGAGDIQCVNTTNSGKNTTFYVNFCSDSSTGYTAALHFVDGNEFCANVAAN